jgi:chromosome segregation ATPase
VGTVKRELGSQRERASQDFTPASALLGSRFSSFADKSIMQFTKVVNRILLGSVAFSVSFCLGLLANRDLQKALLTGAITVPATYAGTLIADKRQINQERLLRGDLESEIQELEEEEAQLYESLYAATATRQEVEASINALQSERSQLLNRVSDLHSQRNELYQELSIFQKQKQQQEEDFYTLQTQFQQLERDYTELNQSLLAKTSQISQTEARLNRLANELEKVQSQVLDKQLQQDQLNQNLAILESRKQLLGGESYELQIQIQVLEQRRGELSQDLLPLQIQQQQVEASLTSKQAELKQLQKQVSEKQKQQKQLNQDLATLERKKQQLETEFHNLQNQKQQLKRQKPAVAQTSTQGFDDESSSFLPEDWVEWLKFAKQLSDDEQRTLKAILERDESTLKRIADEKLTMPQVLISSINDSAVETFNDILFVGGGASVIPEVNEEYFSVFQEPITIYFKDLLKLRDK